MPRIFLLDSFKKDYKKLSRELQQNCEKSLQFLRQNPEHPSLRTKKMWGELSVWEARMSGGYRITFKVEGDCFYVRRVGTHDILKRP